MGAQINGYTPPKVDNTTVVINNTTKVMSLNPLLTALIFAGL